MFFEPMTHTHTHTHSHNGIRITHDYTHYKPTDVGTIKYDVCMCVYSADHPRT